MARRKLSLPDYQFVRLPSLTMLATIVARRKTEATADADNNSFMVVQTPTLNISPTKKDLTEVDWSKVDGEMIVQAFEELESDEFG